MKNRDVFAKDPAEQELLNNGVAVVNDAGTAEEMKTLRYELEIFVCDGQYQRGMDQVLGAFLRNLDKPEQPGVWVSGFFGSGKSHFVKALRYLWVDTSFSDGVTARGLAHLPRDVKDDLKELSTAGKRHGGLHAAAGTLGAGAADNVRMALLGIVFRSAGLPEQYPLARFVMWLRDEGKLQAVKKAVEEKDKRWETELQNMYVSSVLGQALCDQMDFAKSPADARSLLKTQFPNIQDVTTDDMLKAIRLAISKDGKFPCTLIALDEVQQYIADSSQRTNQVQEITEACCKHFEGQLLFVATGQTALTHTPQLQKLRDRFPITVQLSDEDVETVIRKVILQKKPDKISDIDDILSRHSGEIDRHLAGTKIEPRTEDKRTLVPDYPLLPVRRRFWERVLRAVDVAGTTGQLRSQIRIVHEAARSTANEPLGTVVPADFVFDQKVNDMLQTGKLPREIHDTIKELGKADKASDVLKARLCALIFLIGQLPRDAGVDLGVRANCDTLADLLVDDLTAGSASLRKKIPVLLQELVNAGKLMQVDNEYRLQTRESSAWDTDYRNHLTKLNNDDRRVADLRSDHIQRQAREYLGAVRPTQGKCRAPRQISLSFGGEPPLKSSTGVPVWVRDGWSESEKAFDNDARASGNDNATVHVFMPRRSADALKNAICSFKAAEETLQTRGVPATPEGLEARNAMVTRKDEADGRLTMLLSEIVGNARVVQSGGQEIAGGMTLTENVEAAAGNALIRLYPEFDHADHPGWEKVVERARKGSGDALEAVGHKGEPDNHPVCAEVIKAIGSGNKGSDVRRQLDAPPYGWPADAIEGALYVLLAVGHVSARLGGQAFDPKQQDRGKLRQADFRCEKVTVTTIQKLAVRKLITDGGIPCKPGEELSSLDAYLNKLLELAKAAGGDPPQPPPPSSMHIQELMHFSGNEQLVAVFDKSDQLGKEATAWAKTADAIKKALPAWNALQGLMRHAIGLPGIDDIRQQADAIMDRRQLLEDPDPVTPVAATVAKELRAALVNLHDTFDTQFNKLLGELGNDQSWQRLTPEQRHAILTPPGLTGVPDINVSSKAELLASLDKMNLAQWRDRRDSLSQRFHAAKVEAAKLFEPKARSMKAPSATLHNTTELDQWIVEVRGRIEEALKDGPVIIQ